MPQMERLGNKGTDVYGLEKAVIVEYYGIDIVTWDTTTSLCQLQYDDALGLTYTTVVRMNQASNQFGLGFRVRKVPGSELYIVETPFDGDKPLTNGLSFHV